MPAPPRRRIIDLRGAVEAGILLEVDEARMNEMDPLLGRYKRTLAEYFEKHKTNVAAAEENHMSRVQATTTAISTASHSIKDADEAVSETVRSLQTEEGDLKKLQDALSKQRDIRQRYRHSASLLADETEQVKAAIARHKDQHAREQAILDEHQNQVLAELQKYRKILGMELRVLKEDVLQFVFTKIDPRNLDREFSVVIDVSQSDYRVPSSQPMLPALPGMVETLNIDRDIYTFIKRVRLAFGQYVREERGETSLT